MKFLNPDLLVTETLVLLHEVREGVFFFFLKRERISVALYSGWGWMRDLCLLFAVDQVEGPAFFFLFQEDLNILNSKQALYRIVPVYFPLL